METELTHVARRETKSILRERGYPGMSTLSFQRIFQEMSALCPTVYSIISQMMQVDTGNSQDRKADAMALMSCNGSLSLSLSRSRGREEERPWERGCPCHSPRQFSSFHPQIRHFSSFWIPFLV